MLLTWSLSVACCPGPCSSIVCCHIANGDMTPVSCVKEGEGGNFCYSPLCCPSSFIVIIEHPLLVATSPTVMWPLLLM